MENEAGSQPPRLNPQIMADVLRKSLSQGVPATLTVSSKSMAPLLWPEDKVILTAVTHADLQAGDIITYFDRGHLVTHRFWWEEAGKLFIRGDRPIQFDPPVRPEQLVGRVQARRRKDRILWLDVGRGAWLNQHLAKLAQHEQRWLPQNSALPKLTLLKRIRRKIILAWAIVLCSMVNLTARKLST